MHRTVDSALDVNSLVTSRKIAQSYPVALNAELEARSQQSVLPNNRMADSRTKDVNMLMKDVKLIEKIGRKHRTDPSSLTEPTNVLTVQATMEHVIVQQGSNYKHHPLAILLMVQVFTEIIHNFKIIHPNNIHNKVHPQWAYQLPP